MPENGVVDKIKKLLSLALNNPNESEAAVAMSKARELMIKHAIEESALAGKDKVTDVEVIKVDIGRYFESWMKIVHVGVAKVYDAKVYITSLQGRDVATFVCAEYDAELLKETNKIVVATILREAAVLVSKHTGPKSQSRNVATSFKLGAAHGFIDAVTKAVQAKVDAKSTALVLARTELVARRSKELFPNTRSTSISASISNQAAYSTGYQFGSALSTDKGNKKIE